GLDCSRVSRIEPFSVRLRGAGGKRAAARLEFPDLKVTLSEATSKAWADWHEDFVVKGNNGAGKTKTGVLTLLSADHKGELARVRLSGVGIYRLARAAGADGVQ